LSYMPPALFALVIFQTGPSVFVQARRE
jgi:hypothetical protein